MAKSYADISTNSLEVLELGVAQIPQITAVAMKPYLDQEKSSATARGSET